MAKPRIYVDLPLNEGEKILLPEAQAHHLVQVLRLRIGEDLTIFNGQDGEFEAVLTSASKREVLAWLVRHHAVARESSLQITLGQCVSKGDRMDYTLQKAVELGVAHIVPLLSERSVVKLDAERWEKKMEHWRGVIVSSCEQSGRTRIPVLEPVINIQHWLPKTSSESLKLTLAPGATQKLNQIERADRPITLLVGPEGGLSDAEIERSRKAGFEALSLGPRILRTETAGVAALAVLQSQWGDLD